MLLSATHGLSLPYQILTPQHICTLHMATGFLRENFLETVRNRKIAGHKIGKNISRHILFRYLIVGH